VSHLLCSSSVTFVHPPHTSLVQYIYTVQPTHAFKHHFFSLHAHARSYVLKDSFFLFLAGLHLVHVLGHDDIYSLCGTYCRLTVIQHHCFHDTHPNETSHTSMQPSRLPLRMFTHSITVIINLACHVEMRSDLVELVIEWGLTSARKDRGFCEKNRIKISFG
jgi:hypothetical protein